MALILGECPNHTGGNNLDKSKIGSTEEETGLHTTASQEREETSVEFVTPTPDMIEWERGALSTRGF